MVYEWSYQSRFDTVAQRIEPDRRFELRALGNRKGQHATNAVKKGLLVEEPPVVSGCSNGQYVFDYARARLASYDIGACIHELTNVNRQSQPS